MSSKIRYIMIAISICYLGSIKAQEYNSINVMTENIWYSYSTEGELISCTFLEKKIVYNSSVHSNSAKSISEVAIKKKIDSHHFVVYHESKKAQYAIVKVLQMNSSILQITTVLDGDSVASVEKDFKNNKVPSWISLFEKEWYSESYIKTIEKLPGLDELKRKDLLVAMQWRKPLSEKIEQYLKDTEAKRQFMVYRFVNEFRNKKLLELGYNPYKRVVYNLRKQFEGDEEVMKLLFEEIKF